MNITEYFNIKRPDLKDKLLPQQIEMLNDLINIDIKSQALSCGRGFGKTMLAALTALYFADEYSKQIGKPITILLISAQRQIYDRIDEFFLNDKTLKPRLRTQPGAQSGYEIPREKLQFLDTHSIIYDVLPTIKQIEGIRADVVIFDESQDIPRAIYEKAIGCLKIDNIGKLIVIGTPYCEGKGNNWFIEIVSDPKEYDFKLSRYSSEICIWNDIDRWKKTWTKARQKAEMIGLPPSIEERQFFPVKHIEACVLEVQAIRESGVNGRIDIGIDFGLEDATVLIVTERIGNTRRKILFRKVWDKKDRPVDICGPEILEIIRNWNPYMTKGDSKPEEYINWFKNHGNKIIPVDFSIHKENMMGQLERMVREHRLIIPIEFMDIVVALREYKLRIGEKYYKGKGRKTKGSDLVEALALSCYESDSLKSPTPNIVQFPRDYKRKYPYYYV